MALELSVDPGIALPAPLRTRIRREVARMVKAAALSEGRRDLDVALRITDDATIHGLNRDWRGKDKPTNVLSFPMLESSDLETANVAGPELLLGDIVLARGVCLAEAADKQVTVEDHATHLIVHGTLHLLGYDHHDDGDAADMEAREIRALHRLGIANPYEIAV
jgi:probable rRNA maturation factor